MIWLCSLVLALAALTEMPDSFGLVLFIAATVLALILLGQLTGSSARLMRLERDTVLLPMMSSLLTLLVPLGHLFMLGRLPIETTAVWLVFLTYTMAGVVYTRVTVRAVLGREAPAIAAIMVLTATAVFVEVAALGWLGWMRHSTALVLAPMFLFWMAVRSAPRSGTSTRTEVIRRIGFLQSGNMIAMVVILAVALRM